MHFKKICGKKLLIFVGTIMLNSLVSNAQWQTNGSNIYFNSGNVGIGVTSPTQRLEVGGLILTSGTAAGVRFNSRQTDGNDYQWYSTAGMARLYDHKNLQDRMVINQEGKVGIGTLAPENQLHLLDTVTELYTPSSTTTVVPNGILQNIDNESGVDGTAALLRFTIKAPSGIHPISYMGAVATGTSTSAIVIGQRTTNGYSERMRIDPNGNVAIGTIDPKGYKLAVAGTIITERIKVKLQSAWPDYVFQPEYKLPSLMELENFIKEHQHLPDVPSAEEVTKEGVDMGEMNKILLQKIEELTLHLIEQEKYRQAQDKEINELKERLKKVESR